MKNVQILYGLVLTIVLSISNATTQEGKIQIAPSSFSDYTKSFMSVESGKIALINAKIIDGTGSPSQISQTILIEQGLIIALGKSGDIKVPTGFDTIDLRNKTLIPGIVGTHNHMRLPNAAMLFTSPKLYLAAGVTTIQTCGTGNPVEEIAISKAIKAGQLPGPEIINSSPYFTGPDGKSNFIRFTNEKMVRDTIRFWAQKGVKWFKAYMGTRPEDLRVIIDEAHQNGAKVSGHLCATTYKEAAALGIDAIEHGFIHSRDHATGREEGKCSGSRAFRSALDIDSDEVRQVQQSMIQNNVALSTTPAIFEAQARGIAEERNLAVMAPIHVSAYEERRKRMMEQGKDWYFKEEWLQKSLAYDLAFYKAGGLLTAGLDPGLHNAPGFGDQKNYELFIEAGFKAVEAIQVMTLNGALLLGKNDQGSIEKGKVANLVVLNGDLEKDPTIIRKVETVFKNGIGYDPEKLIAAVAGNVGSRNDNSMAYFGQKEPGDTPELFAPNLISKPNRYEFGCAFSKNGKEFFFGVDSGEKNIIYQSQLIDGVWTTPKNIFKGDPYSYNDPMLSPDENRLYFISNRPLGATGDPKDIDIWYSERAGSAWSKPINAGPIVNSHLNEYYASFTAEGTLYFAAKDKAPDAPRYAYDIYRSPLENGEFTTPQKLPEEINTHRYEADVFIAPDESYMIFCAIRRNGLGQGDLYISFKDENGNWTPSKNMGEAINTEQHELCPFISGDGKYLFFTSKQDIYWVSTSVIEKYRDATK